MQTGVLSSATDQGLRRENRTKREEGEGKRERESKGKVWSEVWGTFIISSLTSHTEMR